MKTRDIVIGLVVLVILVTAALIIKRSLNKKVSSIPSQQVSIQQKIQNTFPGLNIPDDSIKSNLVDVSGGQSFGVATNNEILANLPDLSAGKVYKAWLANSQGKTIFLGNLKFAKGGYLIDYNSSNYPNYNKVIITLDDKHILEGSF